MSALLEKIRSRAYRKVIIRPATFAEKRIANRADLCPLLEDTSVSFKGWNFPHVDKFHELNRGPDWISQEISWGPIVESWRFYQSGQFVHYFGLPEDWSELTSTRVPANDGIGRVFLDVKDVVLLFAEIFEFAARLAFSAAGDDGAHLEINVDNIDNHFLKLPGLISNSVSWIPEAKRNEIGYSVDVSRVQLVTETRELALKPTQEFFQSFGWNPGIRFLRDYQDELLPRRSGALR